MTDRYNPFGLPYLNNPADTPDYSVDSRFPDQQSTADAYRMGGLAAMDQYRFQDAPHAVFGAYDRARGQEAKDETALQGHQRRADALRAFAGQGEGPADIRSPITGMNPVEQQRMADTIGNALAPDNVFDAATFFNPLKRLGAIGKALPALGGVVLGADEAQAAKLYVPHGRIGERQAAGFSLIKGGTPVDQMNWTLEHGARLPTRTTMPVDKALRVGDEILPIVGDPTRKLGEGGYLGGVGQHTFKDPVKQEGGFDFALGQPVDPHTGLQDVWGNNPSAATALDKMARAALEAGRRPVAVSTMMGKTGGDFHNQTYETVRQMTDPALFSADLKAAIDRNMLNNRFSKNDAVKGWPGIGSENLEEFIKERGGNVRAKLMKVLDNARVIQEGGPDVGMARIANTNPDLYGTPSGYMGYHIADVTPGSGVADHSTFPVATRGSNVRGLGGSVPGELVMRDLAAGLQKMHDISGSPQYLNRMDYFAIKAPQQAAVKMGLEPLPKTQIVDQQMIDSIGEYVRKHGLKAIPPAMLMGLGRGQMGSTAATDGYNAQ